MHTELLRAASSNPHQQHRVFYHSKTTVAAPTRSINSNQYWTTLGRNLKHVLSPDTNTEWNAWVAENGFHTDLNRLIVIKDNNLDFQMRAAILLLVPNVRKFDLFERPPCDGYRNLLHIVRGWLPHAGRFPKKESEFLGKLMLLSAHSELAQDKDVLAYVWCISEALNWKVSVSLRKKLVEFLSNTLPFIEHEDSMLFARIKQALHTHNAR